MFLAGKHLLPGMLIALYWTWMNEGFQKIIQMNLAELIAHEFVLTKGSIESIYLSGMIYYLCGDIETLSRHIENISLGQSQEQDAIKALLGLRLEIRKHEIQLTTLEKIRNLQFGFSELEGEKHFVLGYAYDIIKNDVLCKEHFALAYQIFHRQQIHRKAVKALHNVVAAESRIAPKSNYTAKYFTVFRMAKKVKETAIAGAALLNISREYVEVGAFEAALKYSNFAIKYLKDQPASVDYYMIVVQRCLILTNLKRFVDARVDYELAKIAPFAEVKAAVQVIEEKLFNGGSNSPTDQHLDFSWSYYAKLKGMDGGLDKLTKTESQLFEFLARGPKDKFEIVQHLYGEKIDQRASENRFHVFMTRVRKKYPHMIVLESNMYRLANAG